MLLSIIDIAALYVMVGTVVLLWLDVKLQSRTKFNRFQDKIYASYLLIWTSLGMLVAWPLVLLCEKWGE